jgi:hypothetical protein
MSTTLGVLVGLLLTLATALVSVVSIHAAGFEPDPRWAGGGATAASAEPAPAGNPFQDLDHNRDGRLALSEAAGEPDIVTKFRRADRNNDGKLTKAEYQRLLKLKDRKKRPAKAPKKG